MKKIIEILVSFLAYLKRPVLYPELLRKIWKNLFNRSSANRGKDDAIDWCKTLAITEQNFIEDILKLTFVPFHILFEKEYRFALSAQENSPVKMGGAGSLNVIYYINEYAKSQHAIETGVAYGWSY